MMGLWNAVATMENIMVALQKIKNRTTMKGKLSRVWLFATPWTVIYQAPPSMGFSRQEYWSGLPFPSPGDLFLPRDRTRVSHIVDRRFTVWATRIPLLGIYPKELKAEIWRNIGIPMFTAALFTITKRYKQPKRRLTDQWVKKMW